MGGPPVGEKMVARVVDRRGEVHSFIIRDSWPLKRLMDAYCRKLGLTVRPTFTVELDCEPLRPDETAQSIDLQHDELIFIMDEKNDEESHHRSMMELGRRLRSDGIVSGCDAVPPDRPCFRPTVLQTQSSNSSSAISHTTPCLLYTSDAADE